MCCYLESKMRTIVEMRGKYIGRYCLVNVIIKFSIVTVKLSNTDVEVKTPSARKT